MNLFNSIQHQAVGSLYCRAASERVGFMGTALPSPFKDDGRLQGSPRLIDGVDITRQKRLDFQ